MLTDLIKNLKKDFKIEFRNKYAINISLAFAGISTLTISLILGGRPLAPQTEAIIFWIILFFSAISGLAYIFVREEEKQNSLFLAINFSPETIYLSKLIFNIILFFVIQTIVALLYIFFRQLEIKNILLWLLITNSGGLAISITITILGAMIAKTNNQGGLFTVISFPLLLPVLWVAISGTARSLQAEQISYYKDIYFLLAFSGIILTVSFLLFKSIWSEK